jgi:hypothetical protein
VPCPQGQHCAPACASHQLSFPVVKDPKALSTLIPAGAIPDSLALHEALESLDVSKNRLSKLPANFLLAPSTARVENSPLRNLKLSHNLFEVHPAAERFRYAYRMPIGHACAYSTAVCQPGVSAEHGL